MQSSKKEHSKENTNNKKVKYGFSRLAPIFPVYLFSSLLDYPETILDEFHKNYKQQDMHNNGAHLLSTKDYTDCIVTKLDLQNLKQLIIDKSKIFCKELQYKPKSVFLNSWITVQRPGEHVVVHNHINSDLSGVFYIKANKDSGILFLRNPLQQFNYTKLFKRPAKPVQVEPVEGKIVLWPSFIDHGVEKNNTKEDRIAIAFNLKFSDEEINEKIENEKS